MSRVVPVVMVAVVGLAACGGEGSADLASELVAATHVVEVAPEAVTVVDRDVSGVVPASAQPHLDVVELDQVRVIPVSEGAPELGDPVVAVRDELPFGPLAPLLEGADRVVVAVIPLLNTTHGGRTHDTRMVALAGREVTATDIGVDWQLEALWANGSDPADALAETARALIDQTLGRELTERQRQLVELAEG